MVDILIKTLKYDENTEQFANDILFVYGGNYTIKKILKQGPDKARKMFNQQLKKLGADRSFYRSKEADQIFSHIVRFVFDTDAYFSDDGNGSSIVDYKLKSQDRDVVVAVDIATGHWTIQNFHTYS